MSEVEIVAPKTFIGGIYGFRTYDSREIRYVGMTTASVTVRERQHFKTAASGRKTPLYDWLRKEGREHAIAVPLEVVLTGLDDLAEAEIRWIARLRRGGHRLLNLSEGGKGPNGHIWTEKQRRAAGDRARGRPTGVHRRGPESPIWGRAIHSEEQKAKWSAMRKGTNTGAANPNYGKFGPDHPSFAHTMSAASRARLSEMRRGELNPNFGKVASEETRAKRSAALRGRPMPSSVRNAHTRHHTNKGVFKETCRHCIDDRNNERDGK
ncbi:NUMOD3 domain-containing DNA-binding protein [Agromyces sp. Soil535]|uniref:NUMOD3 domain-containing DNA-binding protein n=1 Tax=Agromyces sp. Soil535 TaxID=1736390 RepID=UPI0009E8DCBF|nr:NUMOD3 domain-containing DNA-binding protein [Agromyces sp. Soil535]